MDLFELMPPKIEYKLSLEKELLIAMEDEARWHIEKQYTDTKEVPNYLDHRRMILMLKMLLSLGGYGLGI